MGIMMSSWFEQSTAARLVGSSSVNVLIVGKVGVGKSSLINGVVGDDSEVAREGDVFRRYSFRHLGVDVTIWKSPGLLNPFGKDDECMREILNRCCPHKSDLIWYCTNMSVTRIGNDDFDAIKRLTVGLGKDIWKHAVFVMTFANKVVRIHELDLTPDAQKKQNLDYFRNRLMQWHAKLSQAVVEAGVDSKVVAGIPIVPVGYDKEDPLPDRDEWLSPFWYASILRMKQGRESRILKAKLHQIKLPKQITPDDFIMPQRFLEESGMFLPILSLITCS